MAYSNDLFGYYENSKLIHKSVLLIKFMFFTKNLYIIIRKKALVVELVK